MTTPTTRPSAAPPAAEPHLELLFSPEEIGAVVDRLAREIRADYEGKDPVLIGILKGSVFFLADLCRRLPSPLSIDFIRLASYGAGTTSSRVVRLTKDVELPLDGRDVLIVEDIVDSGHTVVFLRQHFSRHGPRSLRIVALIDKTGRREVSAEADYVGFRIPDGFVVGYGLDLDERFRNLPGIYLVKPS